MPFSKELAALKTLQNDPAYADGGGKQRIHVVIAFAMVATALLIDIVQILFEWLPAVGPIIGWFFAAFGFIVFGIWFMLVGVNYLDRNGAVKVMVSLASCVVELIPFVDMIPALTLGVLSLILITRAEDGKPSMLFGLAARRQAAMKPEELAGARQRADATLERDAKSNASRMVGGSQPLPRQRAGNYQAPTLRDYERDVQDNPSPEEVKEAA